MNLKFYEKLIKFKPIFNQLINFLSLKDMKFKVLSEDKDSSKRLVFMKGNELQTYQLS